MHSLVVGPTRCGKSSLVKALAQDSLDRGVGVLVLDPNNDDWPCSFQTTDTEAFIALAKKSRHCLLIVDEAGEAIGRGKGSDGSIWITSRSRHWGHCAILIAQRAQMVELNVRSQCANAYVFRQSTGDARLLSDQFADESLLSAPTLAKYEFLYCRSCEGTQRMKLKL